MSALTFRTDVGARFVSKGDKEEIAYEEVGGGEGGGANVRSAKGFDGLSVYEKVRRGS